LYLAESTVNSFDESKTELNPERFELLQNYPNPFNPSTNIRFSILNEGYVSLKIFDLLGNEVDVLVEEEHAPGIYNIQYQPDGLASGLYFYQLVAGSFVQTNKMILIN
jgi:hypothetical protein